MGLLGKGIGQGVKAGSGLIDDVGDYVKDLMFLHGTSPEKLGLFNDIGGLPMPSMAVTQKDIPFSWGDIDLIGKPENFNPATNSLNDLYSADAYTVRGKEPFKIPNKDAWEKFSNEFKGFGGNSEYMTYKLANSSSKTNANPEVYRMMDDFFNHRTGGGYKKFAEENGIEIPVGEDGRQRLVDLKYNILDNYGGDYSKWVSSKMDSYFKPENYYLNDKNKIKLYDADEMTRLMKKSRGQGTEGVTGGEGYERAMEASKFKSLDQAKKNKGLLFEKEIADQKYSEMNYQDLPPTSYFESKPARTVGMNEFGGAIVPENIDAKVLKILEDRGIPIERYTDEASRLAARNKFQDQMFSNPLATAGALAIGPNVGQTPQGILALSQGRDTLLSPQESEYLKGQAELQGLLGVKDVDAYNYSDMLPVKRDKASGGYSPAMTGVLRDAIEAIYNIGQSRRTGLLDPEVSSGIL